PAVAREVFLDGRNVRRMQFQAMGVGGHFNHCFEAAIDVTSGAATVPGLTSRPSSLEDLLVSDSIDAVIDDQPRQPRPEPLPPLPGRPARARREVFCPMQNTPVTPAQCP